MRVFQSGNHRPGYAGQLESRGDKNSTRVLHASLSALKEAYFQEQFHGFGPRIKQSCEFSFTF